MDTAEAAEQPFYVNAKQYHRILKRRVARAKLDESLKVSRGRRPYLHESRHKHAMRRPRGQGGRFLTAAEIAERERKEREEQENGGGSADISSDGVGESENGNSNGNETNDGNEENKGSNDNDNEKNDGNYENGEANEVNDGKEGGNQHMEFLA